MTSSSFFLSTLNYDARSTTHQIYFIHSFIHLFIHSLTHSLTHTFTYKPQTSYHMMDVKLNCVCVCVCARACCYDPLVVMTHLVLLLAAVQGELGEAGEHSNMSVVN